MDKRVECTMCVEQRDCVMITYFDCSNTVIIPSASHYISD